MKAAFRAKLDAEFETAQGYRPNKADWLDGRWSGLKAVREDVDDPRRGRTGVDAGVLKEIGEHVSQVPDGLSRAPHDPALPRQPQARDRDRGGDRLGLRRGALALGSLLIEDHPIRFSGQDVERGTFSQRHAVLLDQETEERYVPLNHVREDGQCRFEIVNSMLSEEAVLGFEYGYSLAEPNALVLWEAQFGDFANGAQVVFDQFISSGETKWLRMSALVCLLPHGYEGQGPEHSSARLERYLQMCAEDNMQVAYPSTPANYFHILRRQLRRDFRKPLGADDAQEPAAPQALRVAPRRDRRRHLLPPRALGRRPARVGRGAARRRRQDPPRRAVLRQGLLRPLRGAGEARRRRRVPAPRRAALPVPVKSLAHELARFRQADVVWCQEEPKNMGAWSFVEPYLEWVLRTAGSKAERPRYAGRPASAATATGLMSKHLAQLQAFLDEALAA